MWVLTLNGFAGEPLDPAKPDEGNAEWRMRHGERVADVKKNADAPGMWEMGPFVKLDKSVLSPTPDSKLKISWQQ
jgi:hypothetical protein